MRAGMWSLSRSARAYLLAVEVLALAVTTTLLLHEAVTTTALVGFAILTALNVGYAEIGARSQRLTRYLSTGKVFSNPMSVWSFTALLTLPAGWAALFVAGQYAHSMLQRRRERSGNTYRVLFTAAVSITAQLLAAAVLTAGDAPGHALHGDLVAGVVVLGAAAVFWASNLSVLLAGMYLAARPPSIRVLIPPPDTLLAEGAALLLGVIAAEFLVHSPVLLPITLVFVVLLQRSTAVKALQQAARTDTKTGLLTVAAWTASAHQLLGRLARSGADVAVLVIDLDHFKTINDQHGHLLGDRVLEATASCLRRELRDRDSVGRFGGEEFIAILAGLDLDQAAAAAERVRASIGALRVRDVSVTASIGVAYGTAAGDAAARLADLLNAADRALYAAKRAGRNRIETAPVLLTAP